MKALLAVFLALSILSGGVIIALDASVAYTGDQVEVYESVIMGDPSAAEGVTVTMTGEMNDNLHWSTAVTPGGGAESDMRFYHWGNRQDNRYRTENYMSLSTDVGMIDDMDNETGIGLAYKELYDSLQPGEEKRQIVYVKDYYDYYPIVGWVDKDNFHVSWSATELRRWGEEEMRSWGDGTYELTVFMNDYFKIPVLSNEAIEISVSKVDYGPNTSATSGFSYGYGSAYDGQNQYDVFNLYAIEVMTDDAVYFTFDAHTVKGSLADMSEIKGGYGIYRLPYSMDITEKGRQAPKLHVEDMEMICPLDPESEKAALTLSPDGGSLMLHTRVNGKYTVLIVDMDTGEVSQTLTVTDWESLYGWAYMNVNGAMAVELSADTMVLFTQLPDGTVETPIIAQKVIENQYSDIMDEENTALWYDGTRLIAAETLKDEFRYDRNYGFTLTVYEPEGVTYCGKYTTSLNLNDSNVQYKTDLTGLPPLKITG